MLFSLDQGGAFPSRPRAYFQHNLRSRLRAACSRQIWFFVVVRPCHSGLLLELAFFSAYFSLIFLKLRSRLALVPICGAPNFDIFASMARSASRFSCGFAFRPWSLQTYFVAGLFRSPPWLVGLNTAVLVAFFCVTRSSMAPSPSRFSCVVAFCSCRRRTYKIFIESGHSGSRSRNRRFLIENLS